MRSQNAPAVTKSSTSSGSDKGKGMMGAMEKRAELMQAKITNFENDLHDEARDKKGQDKAITSGSKGQSSSNKGEPATTNNVYEHKLLINNFDQIMKKRMNQRGGFENVIATLKANANKLTADDVIDLIFSFKKVGRLSGEASSANTIIETLTEKFGGKDSKFLGYIKTQPIRDDGTLGEVRETGRKTPAQLTLDMVTKTHNIIKKWLKASNLPLGTQLGSGSIAWALEGEFREYGLTVYKSPFIKNLPLAYPFGSFAGLSLEEARDICFWYGDAAFKIAYVYKEDFPYGGDEFRKAEYTKKFMEVSSQFRGKFQGIDLENPDAVTWDSDPSDIYPRILLKYWFLPSPRHLSFCKGARLSTGRMTGSLEERDKFLEIYHQYVATLYAIEHILLGKKIDDPSKLKYNTVAAAQLYDRLRRWFVNVRLFLFSGADNNVDPAWRQLYMKNQLDTSVYSNSTKILDKLLSEYSNEKADYDD